MRKLPSRPVLPKKVRQKLADKTRRIKQAVDRKREAERIYESARPTKWFRAVVAALRQMAGPGERCMLCSGSESGEVEHFKPKATFPELAMIWQNFLWACGICNRGKGDNFSDLLIHPIDENVWDFFYIDAFGNLVPRWRSDLDSFDPRAVTTRDLLKLDRQALQESRRRRRLELVRFVEDCLALHQAGRLSLTEMAQRKQEWLSAPFQPDVADYYLNGPGGAEVPFHSFLTIVNGT